jgi:hypothetical protein
MSVKLTFGDRKDGVIKDIPVTGLRVAPEPSFFGLTTYDLPYRWESSTSFDDFVGSLILNIGVKFDMEYSYFEGSHNKIKLSYPEATNPGIEILSFDTTFASDGKTARSVTKFLIRNTQLMYTVSILVKRDEKLADVDVVLPFVPTKETICQIGDYILNTSRSGVESNIFPSGDLISLATSMGYKDFTLNVRYSGLESAIRITREDGSIITLVTVVVLNEDEIVVRLWPQALGIATFDYNTNTGTLILNLGGKVSYTLIRNTSTGEITGLVFVTYAPCETMKCLNSFSLVLLVEGNTIRPESEVFPEKFLNLMKMSTFRITLTKVDSGYVGSIAQSPIFRVDQTPQGLLFSIELFWQNRATIHREGNKLTLTIRRIEGATTYFVVYNISFSDSGEGLVFTGGNFIAKFCEKPRLSLPPLLPPFGESYPTVEINTELTPNGKDVSYIQAIVTTKSGLCGEYCDASNVRIEFENTNPNFASVVLGENGLTLLDKARNLGTDFDQLARYAILRYVFSRLICIPPFCKFDVNLLLRRYESDFYRKLSKSQFSAATEQLFTDIRSYGQYFKK